MSDFVDMDWEVKKEGVTEIELSDGTKVIVRHVVNKVIKRPEYNPLGEPVYQVFIQNITNFQVPKELRKPPTPKEKPDEGMYG